MYKMVPIATLRLGAMLTSPVYDADNKKLLAAGMEVTQTLLNRLANQGIWAVAVNQKDLDRLNACQSKGTARDAPPDRGGLVAETASEASLALDLTLEACGDLTLESSGDRFVDGIQQRGTSSYDSMLMNRCLEERQNAIEQVDGFVECLASGEAVEAKQVEAISQGSLVAAAKDLDLFVAMGINPSSGGYPGQHCLNVSTLATAIGTTMGLDEIALTELGMGCLVHDAGMLHINKATYQSSRVLDPSDFLEITKHPVVSCDLLQENMERVPLGVRMVVYQMHERCNGSGYPRGRTGDRIHPLAKIAAVADAYIALVSERPHRRAMLPYFAMERMLHGVRDGLYDPAVVRALLHSVSLFPIGSFVAVNDGRVGRVIRSTSETYTRPIVEIWSQGKLDVDPEVINLNQDADLDIVRPLAKLR